MPLPRVDASTKYWYLIEDSAYLRRTMWLLMRSHFMAQLLKFYPHSNEWLKWTTYASSYHFVQVSFIKHFLSHEAGTDFYYDDSDEVSTKLLGAVIIIIIYRLLTYISSSLSTDVWPKRSHLGWNECFVQEVKPFVASNAINAYPNHNEYFHIYTDASDYQLGHVSFRRMFR